MSKIFTRVTPLDSIDALYIVFLAYTVKPMDNVVRFRHLCVGPVRFTHALIVSLTCAFYGLRQWRATPCTLHYHICALKRFALFDLLKSLYSDTKILSKYIPSLQKRIVVKTVPYSVNVNVKNTFTSHIDKKIFLTFFLTSLSLYIFTMWKCIAYN
jgi:hypothetical protein